MKIYDFIALVSIIYLMNIMTKPNIYMFSLFKYLS